ncbi:DUF4230 domain-containing protein [Arthrobacter sp. EH-1B-1]|uniref:DUF4230 domain-containing protein n=1 Tax=Arthrobacter vasquezii TaxID=2977629 RepID=A0ABT6CR00_9MICC|nr:DUF4230 domain-containing protein [Arthrobacter vasquezii]MDF9276241.1 DUF4230 domain-containing protein [Arthrobacter vasquezii]
MRGALSRVELRRYTKPESAIRHPLDGRKDRNDPWAFQGLKGPIIIKFFKRGAITLVCAIVVVFAVFGAVNVAGLQKSEAGQIDRSQPVLLKSIQEISQYHGAVGNFEVVVELEEDDGWGPAFLSGQRTLFVAAGTVNSHVDLSGLADEDLKLSADGKAVTVRLPEAKLDKPNLDFDRSHIFDQERGLFTRIVDAFDTPEQEEFYKLAETKMEAAAEESELRKQAADNTKTMLTGMFGALGIDVTFLEDAPN